VVALPDGEWGEVARDRVGKLAAVRVGVWALGLSLVAAIAMLSMSAHGSAGRVIAVLPVPFLLALSIPWSGRAQSFLGLALRAIAGHFVMAMSAAFLLAIERMTHPGASGHGGFVLILIIAVPFAAVAAVVVGSLAAGSSFGLMRLVDKSPR
jgi:hypothetical protein